MPTRRPNILLISGDEWRADALGCAGNDIVRTPNIDRLAERGVRFTNAYAPAPMCVPSRISLLTGQVPRAHGAITNGITPSDNVSVASLLRDSGYRTGAFGKMHFVPIYADLGFEHMELAEQHGSGWQVDEYHRWLYEEHGLVDWIDLWDQVPLYREAAPEWYERSFGALKSPIPEEAYHTNWITDRFIQWNARRSANSEPWFAWVSYIKPHHPFDPPGKYAELYNPADMPLPSREDWDSKPLLRGTDGERMHFDFTKLTDDGIRRMTAMYFGTITMIDDCVGRMMNALDEQGELDETLVILTSDHGDYLGHRGFITKTPFVLYEDIIRVPFIVAGPSLTEGSVSDAFVNLLDLFPTFTGMAGIEHSHTIHGHDLRPVLNGSKESVSKVAVSETENMIALRMRNWKLIQAKDGRYELYDLEDDPMEHHNRGDEPGCAHIVSQLREAAVRFFLNTRWDRMRTSLEGVQAVVSDEAERLDRQPLAIDPNSWTASWPQEYTPGL